MNQPAKVWPLLKHSPDPRVRSYLIHRLAPLGGDAGAIVKQLDIESDLTIKRALVLSLGEYGDADFTPEARNALLPKLQDMYRTASDPGLHAACEWLLRRWKQEAWLTQVNEAWAKDKEQREKRLERIGKLLANEKEKTPPQWYVNSQGQTFVVIPGPVEFSMGSPPSEAGRAVNETQHKMRIGRTFVLSATSVTVAEYRKFQPRYGIGEIEQFARSADSPVNGTNWFQAVQYCNWLSKEDGIPEDQWCYEIKGSAVKLKAKYLSLSGYRLPTEAEMEFATRAGAVTARYFGETDELLAKYAWYNKNSQDRSWPVGSLKANDLGLFDVQGNVFTWCQERFKAYPEGNKATEDTEDDLVVTSTDSRVLRGGSFITPASLVRSACRSDYVPTNRYTNIGFRPARTLRLGSFTALPATAEGGRK
jgi:formylglycine-generating enzyme required for sulfatase activity